MIKPVRTIEKLLSGSPVTIAAIGDSLTRGWMVRRGYMDYLQEMIPKRFPGCQLTLINRGIPGDTADCGAYRLQWDILEHRPDCVFVQYAINDAFMGFTKGQFKSYIRKIIEDVKTDPEADILLVTSSYIGSNEENSVVEEFYQQLVELGAEYSLPVALTHRYWKEKLDHGETDFLSLVQYDMVHPTELGYRFMAEAIMAHFA